MLSNRRMMLVAIVLSSGMLGGCAPWSTYPPYKQAEGLPAPAVFEPVPSLMVAALRYTRQQFGSAEMPFAIRLPDGTPESVYTNVIGRLGGGARAQDDPNERAYHVTEVRSRGPEAEVDVVFPRDDGLYRIVTISFKQTVLEGYRVTRARPWQIQVEVPGSGFPAERIQEPQEPDEPAPSDVLADPGP